MKSGWVSLAVVALVLLPFAQAQKPKQRWEVIKQFANSDCSGDFEFASVTKIFNCTEVECVNGVQISCEKRVTAKTFESYAVSTLFYDPKCTPGTQWVLTAFKSADTPCVGSVEGSHTFSKSGDKCQFATFASRDCTGVALLNYTLTTDKCHYGIKLTCGASSLSFTYLLCLLPLLLASLLL
eukprot:TRINITY_DN1850_c0_g1_i1.p1 TRINITY_DN1850_c0_g1~~TRINITY_DN1850_c0_g1_i1.p1  ORF type:complete len:182 (+),score=7.85 TRINITY_DN1850_c0_g1_i1:1-546(+)